MEVSSSYKNPSNFFFSHDRHEKKLGPEAMPKFLIVMWYICSVTVVRDPRPGHFMSDQPMGVAVISQNYIKVTQVIRCDG